METINIKEKTEQPLVSIIISAHNAETYLKRCIDSVYSQTYSNIEVICVDAGSTDNTSLLLEFLEQKYEQLIVIEKETQSISKARNAALDIAKGKYVMFLKASDFIKESSCELLSKIMEEYELDLTTFEADDHNNDNISSDETEQVSEEIKHYTGANIMDRFIEMDDIPTVLCQQFYKRELIEQSTPIRFDEESDEYSELLFQMEYLPYVDSMIHLDKILCLKGTNTDKSDLAKKSLKEFHESVIRLIMKVADIWAVRSILQKRQDQFLTWAVQLSYQSLNIMQIKDQPEFARSFMKILHKYNVQEYCISLSEKEHLEYLKEISNIYGEGSEIAEEIQEREQVLKKNMLLEKEPMISVIIPVYNVEKYIKQCIDSVLGQTYEDMEIICIDDGSTDDTLSILEFLAKKDQRLTILRQQHKGVSAARNKGLDHAKGKYISFVDSDDYIQWNSYEILAQVAEENDLDLVIFGANAVGEAPEWIMKKLNTRYKFYPRGSANDVIFSEESASPFLWLHFIKRELLETGGKIRFNEEMEMGEDQLFQFEYVPRAKSVMVIDDKLYNYRIGRNCSLMQLYEKQQMKKFDSHILLITNVAKAWKANGLLSQKEDQVITWMVNLTYWTLITFPKCFQPALAQKVLNVIKEYQLKEYSIAWWEQEHLDYMKEISQKTFDKEEESKDLAAQIKRERYEIQEILKSKAFKLGRMTTKKEDRLDLKNYEKYL